MEFVDGSTVRLVQSNASDDMVAMAAWVSNGLNDEERLQDQKRVEGLINFLYRERHMSPFEHGSLTFEVDCPIFVAREFMRHRTGSYNETSGRYKELEGRFYIPNAKRPLLQTGKVGSYRFEPGTPAQYDYLTTVTEQAYENAWGAYQNMLNAGIAKEVARNVLPVGIMTQFYVTMNPRSVMQFLQLRNDPNALQEIREVAVRIEEEFAKSMPLTYNAYKVYDWRNDKQELVDLRGKLKVLQEEVDELRWMREGLEK